MSENHKHTNTNQSKDNQDYDKLLKDVQAIATYTGVSMKEAYGLYIRNDKDVVKAIIEFEDQQRGTPMYDKVILYGGELLDFICSTIAKGNASRIIIRRGQRMCVTIPVTLGAVGVVLYPYISIMAVLAMMFGQYEVLVEKNQVDKQNKEETISLKKLKFATVDKL